MTANKSLLILPGDGIGPEVMGEVRRVVDWYGKRRALSFCFRILSREIAEPFDDDVFLVVE